MSKKDKVLIIVTIVLIIVLIAGFIWDRNDLVLGRTLDTPITNEMTVESMKKYGFMFWRKSYQAKIRVDAEFAQITLNDISMKVEVVPEVLSYEEFLKYKEESFNREILIPNPLEGTEVAIVKSITSDGNYATYMIDIESEDDAYVYVYFAR